MMQNLRPTSSTSLMVRIGGWFEAKATGWAVVVVPIILIALIVAGAIRLGAA